MLCLTVDESKLISDKETYWDIEICVENNWKPYFLRSADLWQYIYIYIDSLLKMYKAINRAFTIFNVKELFLNIAGMLKRNLKNEITQAFEKRERKELEYSRRE